MSRTSAYQKMRNEILGKTIDVDRAFGPQCWDLAAYVMANYYGGHAIHCGITGYAKDIALQRKTNGILNFCSDVGLTAPLQPGDICVWTNCNVAPLSHIAIYDHDNGQNAVFFLGQNQGANPGVVSICQIPVNGIIGVFRPKHIKGEDAATTIASDAQVLNAIPADFRHERATFAVTVDAIKIRNAPSLKGKDTHMVYKKGMSVNYDGYVLREGYVWISWIGRTGERHWMACGEEKNGRNVKPYGIFR